MPFYTFKNVDTDEIVEKFMSISSLDTFKDENPKMQIVITGGTALIDSHKLDASRRKDNGFKEVLQKIHSKTPGSVLNRTTNI
jgi:hypothetical protein